MMLADLGADVVKVESPTGDPYRAYQGGQYSPHFQAYNRNKRSIALDMSTQADRTLFDELVREADVYIQNFRPGTAARLGAGVERLHGMNPKLVYCSISGFGSRILRRRRATIPSRSFSGFLSVVVDADRPRFLGPALADTITGIYAAYGMLGALFEAQRTGRGRLVGLDAEAMAHFIVSPSPRSSRSAGAEVSDRPRLARGLHPAHLGRRPAAIHLSLEKFWHAHDCAGRRQDATRALRREGASITMRRSAPPGSRSSRSTLQYGRIAWAARRTVRAPAHRRGRERSTGAAPRARRSRRGATAAHAVRPAVVRRRSTSVSSAPLLDEHGPAIRRLLANGGGWPLGRDGSAGAKSV
jgi:hypothetical protein